MNFKDYLLSLPERAVRAGRYRRVCSRWHVRRTSIKGGEVVVERK